MSEIFRCPNCRLVVKNSVIRWSCDDYHAEWFDPSLENVKMDEKCYHTLDLNFNDKISFIQAVVDARYASHFGDMLSKDGPYENYRVVDFPDNDRFSGWSRIGVRKGGFNAQTPLYYVRCKDVLDTEKVY